MESAESNREDESREEPHPTSPSVQEGGSNLLHEKGGMKSAAPESSKQQPLCTDYLRDTALESQVLGHQRTEETVVQRNCNRRGDHESEENLEFNSSSFLENPYLSSERLLTEEIMTIEFVAVMSKKSSFSEKSSTICVAFYKEPGKYQRFAPMKKRGELILGSASIPISDIQKGPIFYKYAMLKNALSADHESRIWDLEHIYGMDSKNTESQLHRVLSIPKEEIKANGTWTIFENMKCYFKKKNYLKVSSTSMPQKSVNCGIIEHLADEFLCHIRLQNGFKNIERKLKIYTENFKIYLGDAAKGEPCSPTNLTEQVLHDNMIEFMNKILRCLETEEHKDDGLLFALHTSFCYNIPLSKDVIIKAETLFQHIGPFQGKFKHLRGKSNYISAVKKMCLRNKGNTLLIWLIPLLYAITEKTDDSSFPETIPLQHLVELRNDEGKQRKVLAMIEIQKSFIESCRPLANTVLEMLALKNFTKQPLLQLKLPPNLLLNTVYQRTVDVVCKASQVHEQDLNGVLNNIAERMEFWFKDLHLPRGTDSLTKPTNKKDALPCLISTYVFLSFSLKHWHMMPFSLVTSLLRILDMFAAKSDVLQENQEFQQFTSERFDEFAGYIEQWLEKSFPRPPMETRRFLENIDMWQQLFSFEILCVDWTQKWQILIYSTAERWLKKVDDRKLLDFFLEFMKKNKCWNTNLESCFTDCVIQRIKYFEKAEEPILKEMVSKVLKTNRSSVGKVLSAVVEKVFSEKMSTLEKDRFDNVGPALAEMLSSCVIYDLLSAYKKSEHKFQNQISEKAKILLSQFSDFFCDLRHQVFSGDIPCNILSIILQHQVLFQNILCICDSSVSSCIATVLKVRKEEYEQLEEQKKQTRSFLYLCSSIEDVINVGTSVVMKIFIETRHFKDQMSISKFSVNGEKKLPALQHLPKYSDMMKKIHNLRESNYFLRLWKQKAEQIKAKTPEAKILSIEAVQENIYKPAIADFQSTYLTLKDFSITLGRVQSHFDKELADESQLKKEFKIMERSEGEENEKAIWVDAALEKIKNYVTLSTVVNTAKMIDELRKALDLNGNFQILSDITKYEELEFRKKTLDYMTQDLMKVKNSLSHFQEETLDFLRELLECTRKGFVSWIKTIIKDKKEIPVFVELASISAGENDMDIDKLLFFRDSMAASAPIIFDLRSTSGFEEFSAALLFINETISKDNNLPKKLKASCDNREWIRMVHDSHGSIEHSSISQARDINSRGIFIISAPKKFKAVLEDCISVQLTKDTPEEACQTDQKTEEYSLAQLTELQNKLMLITTKAEQGREEANRFLEILEKVQMVGKLYLQLLSVGNILFIDWKADIYCNPQHRVKVYTEFGIAGILVQSTRPVLEELDGLFKAMEHCLLEWKKYLKTQRDTYYHLNLFTAHQLFYLCSKLAKAHNSAIEPQILNMLSVIKHDIKEEDIRKALEQALMTPHDSVNTSAGDKKSVTWHDYVIRFPQLIKSLAESGYDTSVAKAALQSCLPESDITEQKLMDFAYERGDDKEEVEKLSKLYDEQREAFLQNTRKFKKNREANRATFSNLAKDELATSFESLPSICDKVNLLWDAFCKKFTGLVSDKYIGLDVFGETLKQLAALETICIKRNLPVGLEARKPSLIMCKEEEMLLYMLSIYRHTRTAPLPTYDEVLVCTPNTEEEEVELIVRRALSSDSQNQKIYCLLGADKLAYKVSKQLESHFFRLLQSSTVHDFKLLIFCSTKAHNSYVITAFDTYKATIPCCSKTEIQEYLSTHLKVPHGTAPVAQAFKEPHQHNVKFVLSNQAGMGKSLFVDNILQKIRTQLGDLPVVHKTIRLMESEIDFQFLLEELLSVEEFPTENHPTVFHIDVSPVVSTGLYQLLIELCILRHIQSPNGLVWKCKSSHLYLIEYLKKWKGASRTRKQEMSSEIEEQFLDLFPAVKCVSPKQVLDLLERPSSDCRSEMKEEQFDRNKLKSEAFQRSYQYLRKYKRGEDLDHFLFNSEMTEGTEKECLKLLLDFCGRHNPSWTELSNFTHFLNFQLSKCEKSIFCSSVVGKDFQGFKTFVVKFMITMSKDFAVPSLDISDESVPSAEDDYEENSSMRQYQLRRKWEQESHPYIVFHADNNSMEFLGFHINNNLDAIDAYSQAILERNVITNKLYRTLEAQHVPFNKKFEDLPRRLQLEALCRVFGVNYTQDPDESYQLTLDNTMKMLAIHLRFQCGIPVIIMGETGCGKTKLVQFMCSLQRAGRDIQNMVLLRVHGGTTSKMIHKKVRQAIELAHINEERHKVDTVLFFDEANTSEAIFAIKEVLCDRSVNGEKILTDRLKVVAACNPYKRHTKETIEKLEKAGLGYRVRSEDTLEKLGYIPLRQLVYRVKSLPPSLLPLIWDFGELNEKTQTLYIREIVKSTMKNNIAIENLNIFTSVISASQKFLRKKKDECRIASLRDIERCVNIALWFYKLRDLLFPQIDEKKDKKKQESILNDAQRALVLSVGACYYVSLESRQDYLEEVAKCFSVPASVLQEEIQLCQEVFLDNLSVPDAIARNDALRENIFMMIVCMDLRVPLFLVGKPGSSKSLSKTIAVDAMEGRWSKNQLFKRCKEIQLVSFQCSPHSKPEGIISTFRQCAQFQKGKNLDEFASVVLLDEIGLAEDSAEMPLKALHPLLEDGCVDDENPESYQKVGFVGISNWALDPAKMNRGLLVFRTDPSEEELVKTAKGIAAAQPHLESIEGLFSLLAKFYCEVLKMQKNEFFGLRDFYGSIKIMLSYTRDKKCISHEEIITKAIQRNFGGSSDINPVQLFQNCIKERSLPPDLEINHTLSLLKENMGKQQAGLMSRYLLLLTTNHAAFHIIQMTQLIDAENSEIIFGSGFPQDQDYSQVCRSVSRVKICMETGRPVVLLNIHNLYESLYDALNQCFVRLGGNYYVDLGLGTHRVKSRVKDEFRLIVIEEKNIVYTQFPTPLLSRLEKHCLDMNTVLNWQQQQLKKDLQAWARRFVSIDSSKFSNVWSTKLSPKEQDVFIGFSNDTCAAVALESTQSRSMGNLVPYEETVLSLAKRKLVQCATPDSILRLKYSFLDDAEQIQDLYFHKQKHDSLVSVLGETINQQTRKERTTGVCLQVSTHARLLNERDLEEIRKTLNLQNKIHCLFLSQFDTEYAFRQELRNFFAQSSGEKLLLIQFHFDEPQSSKRLLACTKYCIIDERRKSTGTGPSHVVLATQVPRVLGGCSYLAFDSGEWMSIHLDDLIPPNNFTANLGQLAKMTIAEIFMTTFQEHVPTGSPEATAALEDPDKSSLFPERKLFSMDSMIKQSIQKAVIQLEDKRDNSQRATERIMIIHNLLFQDHSRNTFSSDFMTVLKRRICLLLQEREKISLDPREWVFRRAVSSEFILEDTSFRHALWMHLEDIVANVFAQILAVVDANNNLDHVSPPSPLSELWLQMFKEESFLRIKYSSKKQDAKISVLSMTEDPNTSVFCQFPFSWVLKAYLEELWERVYNMKGCPKVPMKEPAKLFQELITNVLMPDGSNPEVIQYYTNDFLRMTFPGQALSVYEILSKALLINAKQLWSSVGQEEISFSPIWLHMEYFYLREEYQFFVDLVKSNETVTSELQKMYEKDPPEMFVTLDTLIILLKKVQPTDNLMSFEGCTEWLRRVKSIKPWMERISMDNYQIHLYQKKRELLKTVLYQWTCTNIVYMFFDHLLHNETQIDEKLLRLLVKQFIFIWKRLTETQNFEPAKTFELVTKVLKICNQNADTVYLVKGVKDCKSCLLEITDPAELPCGHIFCSQCICEWRSKQCKICKETFPEDYTPTARAVTREAVACHNKFRRKCNSFFVDFVTTTVLGDRSTPSPEVITQLIQFVACKPSHPEHQAVRRVCKSKSELSPFEECMDTSTTIKSSLLKLLLRHGFTNIKVHLEKYLSEMEEKITFNKRNWNQFYFMVVRCLEDFMYPSSQDDVSHLAESCLSAADLSAFCSCKASKIDTLQLIARLRFSISHVATVLGRQVLCAADPNIPSPHGNKQEEQDLVNAMKQLVANAQTPWPQTFLIRNLYNNYGFITLQKILQAEEWILPRGVEISQPMDAWSNIALMFSVMDRAENQIKGKDPQEVQRLVPVIEQMENILQTPLLPEEPLENKMKKIVDALCTHKNNVLMEVVFHTAFTPAMSQSPLTQLLRNICFKPHVVKCSYLPTMPEDLIFDQKNWKIGENDTLWTCQCGSYWVITDCGRPWEVKQCPCGAKVGGINHNPLSDFQRKKITEDKTGEGYILGSPSIWVIELERDLSPASVCLARALLHSSMLLGTCTDKKAILSLMTEKPKDVAKFFWDHLEKDIELLAEALSRNKEDATVIVHLFLQHLSNATTGKNMDLNILPRQEDRRQWETCFKTLAQPFFQALEKNLTSVKQQRMRDLQGSNLLLQIAYGETTPFEDEPNLGLIGLSDMWQFEQKMSIQTLMHLLQQEHGEGEGNRYPVLLELTSKIQNIQHVQYLPDIFSLQKALIHFFQNNYKGELYSVQQFLDQCELSEDQRSSFCRAIGIMQKVWSNIRMKPLCSDVSVSQDLLPKDINANTAVLKLLPTPTSISYHVTSLLIQLQNSCVETATQITKEKQWIISAEEVKPSSVLTITENDLITAALANSQYVIEEDNTKTTDFDFQTLQRQVIQRFISGKPIINAQTAPSFAPNSMKTLHYIKSKVREQLQQESLSVKQLKQIMEEARSVNAISQTLATLKVASEFLAVTGGDPKRQLSEYVKNELKMDASAEQFRDMPVVPSTQLKHILSLWQTLSAKRSVLLVQMNQNPFCLVSEQYHEELSTEEEETLTTALSTVNLDLFLIELHEMIIVPLDSFDPQWGLQETFRSFLEDRQDDASIANLTGTLSPDLLLKNVVSIWKTAVKASKLHSPTYIQERQPNFS